MSTKTEDTINRLLVLEENWSKREGKGSESRWVEDGIQIYRELNRLKPEETRYKYCLAKLLMNHGVDLKLKYENYRQAKGYFQEILRLAPNNEMAQYHLGYVYFLEKRWEKAATHLHAALSTDRLHLVQQMKALLANAVCQFHLSDRMKADELYNQAKQLDPNNEHLTLFQMTKMQLKERDIAEHKPVLVFKNNREQEWVTVPESHDITDEADDETLILDLRHLPVTLTLGDCVIRLEPKQAEILKELMTSRTVKSAQFFSETIWPERNNLNTVKSYINKLRSALKQCFGEEEVIKTKPNQGYQWVGTSTFYVLTIPYNEFE